MRIADRTVRAAFAAHYRHYALRRKWSVPYHITMWSTARRAFGEGSFDDFQSFYQELKDHWQVFRGGGSAWSAQQAFDVIQALPKPLREKRLSAFSDADVSAVWAIIQSMKDIKVNKYGPSVVAISKFLHFWNPFLFVIVDDGMMWKWVLAHGWLYDQVPGLPKRQQKACDLTSYMAILAWTAGLIRANPVIAREFATYIKEKSDGVVVPPQVPEYEAAAVEWFLLGLVALPPAGVTIEGSNE